MRAALWVRRWRSSASTVSWVPFPMEPPWRNPLDTFEDLSCSLEWAFLKEALGWHPTRKLPRAIVRSEPDTHLGEHCSSRRTRSRPGVPSKPHRSSHISETARKAGNSFVQLSSIPLGLLRPSAAGVSPGTRRQLGPWGRTRAGLIYRHNTCKRISSECLLPSRRVLPIRLTASAAGAVGGNFYTVAQFIVLYHPVSRGFVVPSVRGAGGEAPAQQANYRRGRRGGSSGGMVSCEGEYGRAFPRPASGAVHGRVCGAAVCSAVPPRTAIDRHDG